MRILGAVPLALQLVFLPAVAAKNKDIPCKWKSLTGAEFDLRSLTRASKDSSYYIKDGDIPCTPEVEPTYSYVWNFCARVTPDSFPSVCDKNSQQAAGLQYINRADGYQECNVIGAYDEYRDDMYYSLLDPTDPSKGVSMKYPEGEKCPGGKMRSVQLDVMCDNVEMAIMSALEPIQCEYHIVMKSYRGCPTTCPVTSHGLCNSHGHCAFDPATKKSHCYCNNGYSGDSCSTKAQSGSESVSSDTATTFQVTALVVLLLLTVVMIVATGYKIHEITKYRQEQVDDYYALSNDGTIDGTELATQHHTSTRT